MATSIYTHPNNVFKSLPSYGHYMPAKTYVFGGVLESAVCLSICVSSVYKIIVSVKVLVGVLPSKSHLGTALV